MRYLAIAAAVLFTTTSAATADSLPAASGPVQLSEVQLDTVTAAGKKKVLIIRDNKVKLAKAKGGNATATADGINTLDFSKVKVFKGGSLTIGDVTAMGGTATATGGAATATNK